MRDVAPLMRSALTLLASALLTACAVGPDHVSPRLDAPAHFGAVSLDPSSSEAASAPAFDDAFLQGLNDPLLAILVNDTLRANLDLRMALARYDRADALLRNTSLDALPTITAQSEAAHALSSAGQMPGATRAARDNESWSAGITATWELDLFGRVRRGIEASRADATADKADLQALQVVIVGEVTRTYVELRGTQERLRVAHANRDNQQETLNLVQTRLDTGVGTEFDTVRVHAQLETTAARIPALEAQERVAMHRLAVLSGQWPQALVETLSPPQSLPTLPSRIDAGTPGDLLRRRPDIAAAESRLHAATARIGVATADLFPRFTLGGLIGSQALSSSLLFSRDSETRLVALGIDWSFLDIGRVRARIAAADADAEAELARYRQTVLQAMEDTENALVRHARTRQEDAHLERAALDGAQAARLARVRFEAGAAGLLEVLDAERTQLQAQDAFAEARTRSATSAVALYKALAGGWPTHLPTREKLGDAPS